MNARFIFCGEPVSASQVQLIRDLVAAYPKLSRQELANTVCELLGWVRANGHLKTRECRDFLEHLQAQALLTLPAGRSTRPRGSTTAIHHTARGNPRAPIVARLSSVQPLQLHRVRTANERAEWNEMMDRYHYLGYRVPYGAHIQYRIEADTRSGKLLGGIQFSSAAWRMRARDQWIGWDDRTRKIALPHVINNSRFLILPWVRIANLASHVLARAARQVIQDWQATYAVRPCLIETLVDRAYSGHCYRAANWIEVGETTGRGRQDRDHQRHGQSVKRILLYPLRKNAAKWLRQRPI